MQQSEKGRKETFYLHGDNAKCSWFEREVYFGNLVK